MNLRPSLPDRLLPLLPIPLLLFLLLVLSPRLLPDPSPSPSPPSPPPPVPWTWPTAATALHGLTITHTDPDSSGTFATFPGCSVLHTSDTLQLAFDHIPGEPPPSAAPLLRNLSLTPAETSLASSLIARAATTGRPILQIVGHYYLIAETLSPSRVFLVTFRPRAIAQL